eukprot:1785-Amphidinium_carterae.1
MADHWLREAGVNDHQRRSLESLRHRRPDPTSKNEVPTVQMNRRLWVRPLSLRALRSSARTTTEVCHQGILSFLGPSPFLSCFLAQWRIVSIARCWAWCVGGTGLWLTYGSPAKSVLVSYLVTTCAEHQESRPQICGLMQHCSPLEQLQGSWRHSPAEL